MNRGFEMKKFYAVFATVAVMGLGILGYTIGAARSGGGTSVPVETEGTDELEALRQLTRGARLGSEDAPINIIEFSDFQCPACSYFAQTVKPQLEETLIESGQAKLQFYDFPLISIHPNAFLAARAARCAEDQGQFWAYHDELYRQQARWALLPDPGEAFEGLAEELGMDARDFGGCLNSDMHAELVSANLRLAETLGIPGTPTVLINVGGQNSRAAAGFDYESIMALIHEMTGPRVPDSGTGPGGDPRGGGG